MLSHNGGNRTKCVRHVVLPGIEENVRGVPKENLWLSQKKTVKQLFRIDPICFKRFFFILVVDLVIFFYIFHYIDLVLHITVGT